jgi:NAD(P)-dependent dehydrogenase (short-subunit alcohol dehydrogenase family)
MRLMASESTRWLLVIATQLTQALQENPKRSKAVLPRTTLSRWGEPEDGAGPVLFLVSEVACFVTGFVMPVDGGYLIAGFNSHLG